MQLLSGALWLLVACTIPVGSNSTYHLLYFMRSLNVQKSSTSVTSTNLRPLFLQFISARGPTSFAVPFGYASSTTTGALACLVSSCSLSWVAGRGLKGTF